MNRGVLYGLICYSLWGFFPIYWRLLSAAPALQTLAHRVIWSLGFLLLLLAVRRQWDWLRALRRDRRTLLRQTAAGLLLGVNWFTFIWAVNNNYVIEASLGYFITPLVNVLMGVALLRERLRPMQWLAVGLAGTGVLYLTINYGALPWVALTLAVTFSIYGYLKKRVRLQAIESLSTEMMAQVLPAAVYLLWLHIQGAGVFGSANPRLSLLLVSTGVVTAIPLLLFAAAARRIPLSTLGFLQYISPTFQFLIGLLIFHEPFTPARAVGFAFIWLALLTYTLDGAVGRKARVLNQKIV